MTAGRRTICLGEMVLVFLPHRAGLLHDDAVMARYTRDEIIAAIQQATADDGGKPVGYRRFEKLTGITRGTWYGVYWASWGDALIEAGFEPNQASQATDKDALLPQIAEMARKLGKLPTEADLSIARRSDPTSPSRTALRVFGGQRSGALVAKLRELAESNPAYADILDLLPKPAAAARNEEALSGRHEPRSRPAYRRTRTAPARVADARACFGDRRSRWDRTILARPLRETGQAAEWRMVRAVA